ncbi:MAG: hypothetical protein HQK96_03840 [Nitrospirae bacterium]|nr:hypothetical protein [Nitrospirota bacterium]
MKTKEEIRKITITMEAEKMKVSIDGKFSILELIGIFRLQEQQASLSALETFNKFLKSDRP